MITRPHFVTETLTTNHDAGCYVDPRDGTVCSRGHANRKLTLKYIGDLEAAVDDANYMEQLFLDMLDKAGALPEHVYMREDGQAFYATGYPKEEHDGQTKDTERFEGGEITTVDLERVSSSQRANPPKQPAKGW